MRKQTKLVAALSATALLAVGANRTFFFDTEGRMVTGWIEYTEKDGKVSRYYCDPDDPAGGYAVTGWK